MNYYIDTYLNYIDPIHDGHCRVITIELCDSQKLAVHQVVFFKVSTQPNVFQ